MKGMEGPGALLLIRLPATLIDRQLRIGLDPLLPSIFTLPRRPLVVVVVVAMPNWAALCRARVFADLHSRIASISHPSLDIISSLTTGLVGISLWSPP